MALWKVRSLSPEQKVEFVEEQSDSKSLISDESGSFLGLDDVSMSEIYSCSLLIPVISLSYHATCTHVLIYACCALLPYLEIIGSSFNFFLQLCKCSHSFLLINLGKLPHGDI